METIGIYSPKKTSRVLNRMLKEFDGYLWFDSSWGNDLTDSISLELGNGGIMTIMIPNSTKMDTDNELYNTYVLQVDYDHILDTKSIEEVIKVVREHLKKIEEQIKSLHI